MNRYDTEDKLQAILLNTFGETALCINAFERAGQVWAITVTDLDREFLGKVAAWAENLVYKIDVELQFIISDEKVDELYKALNLPHRVMRFGG